MTPGSPAVAADTCKMCMMYVGDQGAYDVMCTRYTQGHAEGLMLEYVCALQVLANPSTDMQEGSAVSLEDLQDQGVRPYDEKARWLSLCNLRTLCRGSKTACLLVPAQVAESFRCLFHVTGKYAVVIGCGQKTQARC